MNVRQRLIAWLRPKSSAGEVIRSREVEQTELFLYGIVLVWVLSCSALLFTDEWRLGVLFVVGPTLMMLLVRRVGFRPHLVLGADQLVLVGAFYTRRVPYHRVRRAVAEHRSLTLVLTDYEHIVVPGHWGSRKTLWELLGDYDVDVENAALARRINDRARAARAE